MGVYIILTKLIFLPRNTPPSSQPDLRMRVAFISALGTIMLIAGAVLLLGGWRGIEGLMLALVGAVMCFIGSHIVVTSIATLLSLRKKGMIHEEEGE